MFIMTSPDTSLTTHGEKYIWNDVNSAVSHLDTAHSQREDSLIVGALPFFPTEKPVLYTPEQWTFGEAITVHHKPHDTASIQAPHVTDYTEQPCTQQHKERIQNAIAEIQNSRTALEKIVLSRALTAHLDTPFTLEQLFSLYLKGSATGHAHAVDLITSSGSSPAILAGSSPELLIEKKGKQIYSFPLAGTIPRSTDPVIDQSRAQKLQHSAKDSAEHAFVTAEIQRILAPLCSELTVPATPSLLPTSHTWHLGTPISGTLKNPHISVLTLATLLHPTPALGGYPTDVALEYLSENEPNRGFYAGAFGYADSAGDGQWRVTIRSALQCGSSITAHAGGGIVAASDPTQELEETTTKLGPFKTMLGLNNSD